MPAPHAGVSRLRGRNLTRPRRFRHDAPRGSNGIAALRRYATKRQDCVRLRPSGLPQGAVKSNREPAEVTTPGTMTRKGAAPPATSCRTRSMGMAAAPSAEPMGGGAVMRDEPATLMCHVVLLPGHCPRRTILDRSSVSARGLERPLARRRDSQDPVSGGGKYDSCGGRKSDSRQHGLAAG